MNRDAVLELLTENLPPGAAEEAGTRLLKAARQEFAGAGLRCASLEAFATCRRLGLYASGLGPVSGPALGGIFRRSLEACQVPGAPAWEPSGFRFPRPALGLLALLGGRPAPFRLAGLKAGRVTEGHDSSGPRRVTVDSAETYFAALERASVLARDAARLEALRAGLAAASRRMKLQVEPDEAALRANLFLSEYPVPVVSSFPQELLRLPPEAVRAALRSLSFFPVSDAAGGLQPYFAGFRDGASRGQRNVEEGFRLAAEARLAAAG